MCLMACCENVRPQHEHPQDGMRVVKVGHASHTRGGQFCPTVRRWRAVVLMRLLVSVCVGLWSRLAPVRAGPLGGHI